LKGYAEKGDFEINSFLFELFIAVLEHCQKF